MIKFLAEAAISLLRTIQDTPLKTLIYIR
jgi:hypothetical protein